MREIAIFERINTKYSCMYCTKCGAKLREAAKFCHACGKPIARANQAARTVEARNRSTDDVSRTVKAQADKTAVKTEIKEKALDLAKAGAKQILAALKDRNINASATPGEVSCKSDAAQSAFMKMLKKGLICILMLVGFCFSSQAESIFRGLEMDRKIDSEKAITLMVERWVWYSIRMIMTRILLQAQLRTSPMASSSFPLPAVAMAVRTPRIIRRT